MSVASSLDASERIVLACLRDEAGRDAEALAGVLQRISDWSFLQDWEGQGILYLVAERLRAAGLLTVLPARVRDDIEHILATYADIAARYGAETQRVLRALGERGLSVAVLKDFRAYPIAHTRPSYDLDLLVMKAELADVMDAIAALGYRSNVSPLRHTIDDRDTNFERYDGHLRFSIDVHWGLIDAFMPNAGAIDNDELLAARTVEMVHGQPQSVLCFPHYLVNACIHALTHETRFPSRLIVWTDISEALRLHQGPIDWDAIIEITSRYRCRDAVYLGLRVARDLFAADVPDQVLARVRPPVHDLGLLIALYGYPTFAFKFIDDAAQHGCPMAANEAWAGALLAALARAHAELDGLLRALHDETGERMNVHGEPSEMLVPSPRLRMAGNLEVFVAAGRRAGIERVLAARGYRRLADRNIHELALDVSFGDEPVAIRVGLADSSERRASGLRDGPTVGTVLRALATGPIQPPRVVLHIIEGTPSDRVAYLLDRHVRVDAVDLSTIVQLADTLASMDEQRREQVVREAARAGSPRSLALLEVVARYFGVDLPSDAAPRAQAAHTWRLLDAMDRRTRVIEALSKYLAHPGGVHLLSAMSGARAGRPAGALWNWLRKRGPRSMMQDLRMTRWAVTGAASGARVPPRIYLTRAGKLLTHLPANG